MDCNCTFMKVWKNSGSLVMLSDEENKRQPKKTQLPSAQVTAAV